MLYQILGFEIEIYSMQKPMGNYGSVFEFNGSENLREIGLETTFWFRSNYGFSNTLPVSYEQDEICEPQNKFQQVLAIFLEKSIRNGQLTN